jgi:glycosyltransferase involved in cell wall biosynthesis
MNQTRNENVPPEVSVVLPVFNEEESIESLVSEIQAALESTQKTYEVICVDDKSTDNSLAVLRKIEKTSPQIRVVEHRMNWGQSAAFISGFHNCLGELVVTMDADGQNDPSDLPVLFGQLEKSCDAVCGIRAERKDPGIRKIASRIANTFRNAVTGDSLADTGCSLRVIRKDALREIPAFNGLHRFLPSILRFQGFNVEEVPVSHRHRRFGKSKYGISDRLFRGVADCFAIRWFRQRTFPVKRVQTDRGSCPR